MQIASAVISNFRAIEELRLDFTDALGRIRPLSLLAGPNAAGKTSVVDALSIAVGANTRAALLRPDWQVRPSNVVRHHARQATVRCVIRIPQAEAEAVRRLAALDGADWRVPDIEEFALNWEYPDPLEQSTLGRHSTEPRDAWQLLRGRHLIRKLLAHRLATVDAFADVGTVCVFDQRGPVRAVIPRAAWNLLTGRPPDEASEDADRAVNDVQTILTAMAVESSVESGNGHAAGMFQQVQTAFARLCPGHALLGVRRDEYDEFSVWFSHGDTEYAFDGLSSGQKVMLHYITRIVRERIHHSILLVDEVELHQHPSWQSLLLWNLPRLGTDNQVIATTHSEYLRDSVPTGVVVADLGQLADEHVRIGG